MNNIASYQAEGVLAAMLTIDLTGKIALVTGSSRGLGRHYALHLARAGADVIIHDVNESVAAEFGEAPSGPAEQRRFAPLALDPPIFPLT